MDLQLRGKSVLITGASKGIGLATAESFAAEGCELHLTARSADALDAAKQNLSQKYGVTVHIYPLDLSQSENINVLANQAPNVDIVINNAGEVPSGPIESLSEDDWRRGYDLKLFGYISRDFVRPPDINELLGVRLMHLKEGLGQILEPSAFVLLAEASPLGMDVIPRGTSGNSFKEKGFARVGDHFLVLIISALSIC